MTLAPDIAAGTEAEETLRIDLVGLSREELAAQVAAIGLPAFRARQLWHWIYYRGVTDFDAMTNISKDLRARLRERFVIRRPAASRLQLSEDGTRKWLLRFGDGNEAEAVHIPEEDRGALCVSSQVGCTLTCRFCHTGTQPLVRNLSAGEIVGQMMVARDTVGEWPSPRDARMISNVVMMGMGEPLLNYENVAKAIRIFMDGEGIGLSKRRITLSTAGVVPMIERCGRELGVNLAVSLHAVTDALRDEIVPINRRYPIAELLDAVRTYLGRLGDWRSVTIEYTLMDGVNDSLEQAEALAKLLADLRDRSKINLIPFNPFPGSGYRRPTEARVRAFQTHLLERGFATMLRTTRGEDIDAACGQLAGKFEDRTRRRERYIARLKDHGVITHQAG